MKCIEALEKALDYTINLLFNPFNWRFYGALGFLVLFLFLGQQGSCGSRINLPVSGGEDSAVAEQAEQILHFLGENLLLVIGAGVLLFFLLMMLWVLLFYLSCAARFIFLRAILERRVKLLEWFCENRSNAASLFLMLIVIALISLAILFFFVLPPFVLLLGVGILLAAVVKEAWAVVLGVLLIIAGVFFFLSALIAFVLASALLGITIEDFVIPAMVARGERSTRSLFYVLKLLKENAVETLVYVLIKFALGIAVGIAFLFLGILLLMVWGAVGLLVFLVLAALEAVIHIGFWWFLPGIPLGIVFMIAFLYTVALLQVPLFVFWRMYGVIFLGLLDPEADLYPKRFCKGCGGPVFEAEARHCHQCGIKF